MNGDCGFCAEAGDLQYGFRVTNSKTNPHRSTIWMDYAPETQRIDFFISIDYLVPQIHNQKIRSIIDLPGATIVLVERNKLFDYTKVSDIRIETEHGQAIGPFKPELSNAGGLRLFFFRIGPSP